MKIAIGADSFGYTAKQLLIGQLKALGHEVQDVGIHSPEMDTKILDYANAVAAAVSHGTAERGVLLCMSGGIMAIRANRYPHVRAVLGFDVQCLAHDRQASNANILCLPATYLSLQDLQNLLTTFLNTPFEPLERRLKRLSGLDNPLE